MFEQHTHRAANEVENPSTVIPVDAPAAPGTREVRLPDDELVPDLLFADAEPQIVDTVQVSDEAAAVDQHDGHEMRLRRALPVIELDRQKELKNIVPHRLLDYVLRREVVLNLWPDPHPGHPFSHAKAQGFKSIWAFSQCAAYTR
ncbi:hypothetical protein [Ferruginivarius sediminum]|uniref:hypothetical protein n=1 Tax=Ferruginivarius sediminum TaxID=2661937 RepID=UPI0011C0776C|nr:hypothetical protein [Ferruginivarius sediminum]